MSEAFQPSCFRKSRLCILQFPAFPAGAPTGGRVPLRALLHNPSQIADSAANDNEEPLSITSVVLRINSRKQICVPHTSPALQNSQPTYDEAVRSDPIHTDLWHRIVMTYDNRNEACPIALYVDGFRCSSWQGATGSHRSPDLPLALANKVFLCSEFTTPVWLRVRLAPSSQNDS